jgi:anaerobic ribonucleoside-triphosphate reductase activating protein
MNESLPQFEHSAANLYEWVKNTEGIEGVTLTGGEPFEQNMEALEFFFQLIKSDPRRLSVMCYTGKSIAELLDDRKYACALKYIDILVDGSYVQELNDGHKWRGSSNQRIYPLNDEYADIVWNVDSVFDREIEINLSAEMQFELTGIPNIDFMKNLGRKLHEKGYFLTHDLK